MGAPNIQVVGSQVGTATAVLQGVLVTTTGAMYVSLDAGVGGGTQYTDGSSNPGVTGVGTLVIGVQTGSNVATALTLSTTGSLYVANVATGTISIAGVPTFSATAGGTSSAQGFVVAITSGAASIVITSGANTLYITDLLVSVNVPMQVDLRSAATTLMSVYLATNGGFVWPMHQPLALNSNQSLTVLPGASGSCAVTAVGYRV